MFFSGGRGLELLGGGELRPTSFGTTEAVRTSRKRNSATWGKTLQHDDLTLGAQKKTGARACICYSKLQPT